MTVFVDPGLSPHELRQSLYGGNLIAPHDPEHAHEHFDPAEMAKMLGVWKPRFIHDDRSKKLVCDIITEAGLPAEHTHFDLPKPALRSRRATSPQAWRSPSRGTATCGTSRHVSS